MVVKCLRRKTSKQICKDLMKKIKTKVKNVNYVQLRAPADD